MTDARFEDADEAPLRLIATGAEDLTVMSALLQDAITTTSEIKWLRRRKRVTLLAGRFRWEDQAAAQAAGRPYERVQAMLTIDSVQNVQANGIDPTDSEAVLSLLSMAFEEGEDGAGRLILTFAGDGALAVNVEAIDLTLRDITRPYEAQSATAPSHEER